MRIGAVLVAAGVAALALAGCGGSTAKAVAPTTTEPLAGATQFADIYSALQSAVSTYRAQLGSISLANVETIGLTAGTPMVAAINTADQQLSHDRWPEDVAADVQAFVAAGAGLAQGVQTIESLNEQTAETPLIENAIQSIGGYSNQIATDATDIESNL